MTRPSDGEFSFRRRELGWIYVSENTPKGIFKFWMYHHFIFHQSAVNSVADEEDVRRLSIFCSWASDGISCFWTLRRTWYLNSPFSARSSLIWSWDENRQNDRPFRSHLKRGFHSRSYLFYQMTSDKDANPSVPTNFELQLYFIDTTHYVHVDRDRQWSLILTCESTGMQDIIFCKRLFWPILGEASS